MSTLTITGLEEAQRALRAHARDVASHVVAPALAKALGPVARRLADEAPEASGALAGSIAVAPPSVRGGVARVAATTGEDYAAHVDLGTRGRAADDFLDRAYDATARRAADSAGDEILRGIERELRR